MMAVSDYTSQLALPALPLTPVRVGRGFRVLLAGV